RVILADDALLAELLHAGGASDAGGLSEHAAGPAQQLLGGHDLLVGDIHHDAVRLPDRRQGLVRIPGHAHGDGVRQGVLLHGLPGLVLRNGPVDGAAALRLGGDQPGQAVNEANGIQVFQAL
ncbi:HTH-type transcriptional repressor yvoA, partial [Dysosmobacter welbionis]